LLILEGGADANTLFIAKHLHEENSTATTDYKCGMLNLKCA
jgi:hypothetical protein